MIALLDNHLSDFRKNCLAVRDLVNFDEVVMQFVVAQLRVLEDQNRKAMETMWRKLGELNENQTYHLPRHLSVDRTIELLEGIRTRGTLKGYYHVMVNQCVVLLVAHFGSAARNLIRTGVSCALRDGSSEALMRYEVKAFAGELQSIEQSMHEFVADRVIADVSFQDMRSISRAVKQYFGRDLPRNDATNDVIVAHAARHVIVHSGVAADARFINQIRDCTPRAVLPTVREGDPIQFAPTDIDLVSQAMTAYLSNMADVIQGAISA